MKSWWRCFKTYWKHNWEVTPESTYVYVRTPLFVVGYLRNGYRQEVDNRWTGWQVNWIPVKWSLMIPQGECMYRYSWDNLKPSTEEIV